MYFQGASAGREKAVPAPIESGLPFLCPTGSNPIFYPSCLLWERFVRSAMNYFHFPEALAIRPFRRAESINPAKPRLTWLYV